MTSTVVTIRFSESRYPRFKTALKAALSSAFPPSLAQEIMKKHFRYSNFFSEVTVYLNPLETFYSSGDELYFYFSEFSITPISCLQTPRFNGKTVYVSSHIDHTEFEKQL